MVSETSIKYVADVSHPALDTITIDEIRVRSRDKTSAFPKSVGCIDPGIPVLAQSLGGIIRSNRVLFGFP